METTAAERAHTVFIIHYALYKQNKQKNNLEHLCYIASFLGKLELRYCRGMRWDVSLAFAAPGSQPKVTEIWKSSRTSSFGRWHSEPADCWRGWLHSTHWTWAKTEKLAGRSWPVCLPLPVQLSLYPICCKNIFLLSLLFWLARYSICLLHPQCTSAAYDLLTSANVQWLQ